MTARARSAGAATLLALGLVAAGAATRARVRSAAAHEAAERVPLASFLRARNEPSASGASAHGENPHPGIGPVDPDVRGRIVSLRVRLASDAADDRARVELARLLADSHESAGSMEAFRAYLRRNPTDADAWLDFGRVLFATGDRDGASSAMRAALRVDPHRAEALYNLGAIAANEGRLDEAADWWRRVVRDTGDTAMVRRAMSSLDRIGVAP